MANGFDLLAEGVEFHRVAVRAGAGVHVSRHDLELGPLPGTLINECDVDLLGIEIAQLLGEHVRQVDLLVETADHHLEIDRLHRSTRAGPGGRSPATGTEGRHRCNSQKRLTTDSVHGSFLLPKSVFRR